MRQRGPYHRRIDAGILAGMIVPPPSLELYDDADEPLTRDSASARLRDEEPDDEHRQQRSRDLERVLGNRSRY
jgi:hypothetical protein